MARNILFALLGAVVGWGLASFLREPSRAADPAVAPGTQAEDEARTGTELAQARAADEVARVEERRRDAAVDSRTPEELYGPALAEHFRREFVRGWLSLRKDQPAGAVLDAGEKTYQRSVREMPQRLGERAAREANERDALVAAVKSGDGLLLLAAMDAGDFEPSLEEVDELVDHALVPRHASGSLEGAELSGEAPPELTAGVTLRFGPGVHVLDERKLRGPDGRSLPADVSVIGAGMDSTLLRIGDVSINSDVERLALRDMTIDTGNDGLFDLRGVKLLLDMERVRVVRFDAGHGGSYVFDANGGSIVRARSCQFIGGYGKSPGRGWLYRNGPILARFENCHFELFERYAIQDSKIVYRGCTFELLKENPLLQPSSSEKFISCTFSNPLGAVEDKATLAKDLSDLFWQVGDH